MLERESVSNLSGWRIYVDLEPEDVFVIAGSIGSVDPYPEELIEWVNLTIRKEIERLKSEETA